LLRKYGSLENAIAAGRLATQAKQLRLYRSIATMNKSAPLPALRNQKPTWAKAAALARDWGLNRLTDRLGAFA
jgi:DNA polymerase-1